MLTAREPSVKPLADVVRCYIRCDGQNESRNIRHLSHLPSRINGRARPQNKYIINFGKKIQETMRPAKASPFGRGVTEGDGEGKPGRKEPLRSDGQAFCQSDTIAVSGIRRQHPSPLSLVASSSPAPPEGEPLACRLGFPSYNLSVSLRSTAPLVGEPLAKPFTLRGLPKPPLGRGGGTASAVTERLSSSPSGGDVPPTA